MSPRNRWLPNCGRWIFYYHLAVKFHRCFLTFLMWHIPLLANADRISDVQSRPSAELFEAIDPSILDEMGGFDGSPEALVLISRREKILPTLEAGLENEDPARRRLAVYLLQTIDPGA